MPGQTAAELRDQVAVDLDRRQRRDRPRQGHGERAAPGADLDHVIRRGERAASSTRADQDALEEMLAEPPPRLHDVSSGGSSCARQ